MDERDYYRQLAQEYSDSMHRRERGQLVGLAIRSVVTLTSGILILTGGRTDIPYFQESIARNMRILEHIGFDVSPENLKKIALTATPIFLVTTSWSAVNYVRTRRRTGEIDSILKKAEEHNLNP